MSTAVRPHQNLLHELVYSSDKILSPLYFPLSVNFDEEEIQIVRMSRDAYRSSTFLDDRIVRISDQTYSVSITDLAKHISRYEITAQPTNYIFHTGFCGSTLLTRCIDVHGKNFSYREPKCLHQISWYFRHNKTHINQKSSGVTLRDTLHLVSALLSRGFLPTEKVCIKPSDGCNNLAEILLNHSPDSKAILLYSELSEFVISTIQHKNRRNFLAACLLRSKKDAENMGLLHLPEPETTGQTAGYVWLIHIYNFLNLLELNGTAIRSLCSHVLFHDPLETLNKAVSFFDLDINRSEVEKIVNDVMNFDAKQTDRPYDFEKTLLKRKEAAKEFQSEIEEAYRWVDVVTQGKIPEFMNKLRSYKLI